jgi:hypothetical protein
VAGSTTSKASSASTPFIWSACARTDVPRSRLAVRQTRPPYRERELRELFLELV